MGFSRWEYWNGLPFPPALDLPDPGIEPMSPATLALTDRFLTTRATRKACVETLSHIWLFETAWAVPSMAFSRPEYWNGQPFPSPGDLPNPGIELRSLTLQADSLQLSHRGGPRILEWVAYPFSSWSSQPRNWTRVSCIAGIDSLPTEWSGKPVEKHTENQI